MPDLISELRQFNLQPQNVVAAVGGNTPEIWTLLKATDELGLVLALINDAWSAEYAEKLVSKLGAQLVIGYGGRSVRGHHFPLIDCQIVNHNLLHNTNKKRTDRSHVSANLQESVASTVVFSTSGSTGEPKCVVSTRRNREFCTSVIGNYLNLSRGQHIINALPPSFDYGFYQGLLAQEFGLELELIISPQMIGELLNRVRRRQRIVLPLTPTLAANLCKAMNKGEEFTNVEIVSLTGGATSPALRKRLAVAFPEARIFAMYGLTECKRVAYLDPEEFLERLNSCGKEISGISVDVVDTNGLSLPRGEIGELTVKGENVCLGYWNDVNATESSFKKQNNGDTLLFTGDLFRRDVDGYLEFIGRADTLVKVREERVSLAIVEKELRSSEAVLDLRIQMEEDEFGIPLLKAFVVPSKSDITDADIFRSFRRHVSRPGHLPNEVIVVGEIGVNEHGKQRKF
jgi:acyl-coenzyme A synthetase/AMP-(fatty) acid ligase